MLETEQGARGKSLVKRFKIGRGIYLTELQPVTCTVIRQRPRTKSKGFFRYDVVFFEQGFKAIYEPPDSAELGQSGFRAILGSPDCLERGQQVQAQVSGFFGGGKLIYLHPALIAQEEDDDVTDGGVRQPGDYSITPVESLRSDDADPI